MSPTFAKSYRGGGRLVPKWILGKDNVLRKHYVRPASLTDPDPVTRDLYAEAPDLRLDAAARAIEGRMFGGPIDAASWGRLVGGIAGSQVDGTGTAGALDSIEVAVAHPWLRDLRRNLYRMRSDGVMTMDNETLYKHHDAPYRRLGFRIVGTQILAAQALGFTRVITYGSGAGTAWGAEPAGDIGYWYWPLLGFEAPLEGQHELATRALPRLASDLGTPGAAPRTIQALLALPGGLAWWKRHGGPLELTFELTPDRVTRMLHSLRKEGIWLT